MLTNESFKNLEIFSKYSDLYITNSQLNYIDSLSIFDRFKLLEKYKNLISTIPEILSRGYLDIQKHPEILFMECLIVYGTLLEYPDNFFEVRHKKPPLIFYKKKGENTIKKKLIYKFLSGNAYSLSHKFGFNVYQNPQKAIDLLFGENKVTAELVDDSYEFECNDFSCPYRTSTCHTWTSKLDQVLMDHTRSKECGIYMKQKSLRISKEIIQKRLFNLYKGDIILLEGYKEVQSKAVFLCNRKHCQFFNICNYKIWETIVNSVLKGDCLFSKKCYMFNKSTPEYWIFKFLEDKEITFQFQKSFPNLRFRNPLRFDFYLPDYNLCIEYQGRQHYDEKIWPYVAEGASSFEENLLRDEIKKEYCLENDIFLLEIPYSIGKLEEVGSYINFVLENLKEGVFDYDISNWRSSRLPPG